MELKDDDGVKDLDELSLSIDELIINNFALYKTLRQLNMVNCLQVCLMEKGWQDSLYASKMVDGKPKSQIKMPLIINELPDEKFIKN